MKELILRVQAEDNQWSGADQNLPFEGATDVQVTQHPNQIYDQIIRVTWVHNGRAYEAEIKRVRQHGHLGN
ncbi:MAG: hypothetical protein HY040_12015 [Planctomycetes bacterium]|nr:hypothetical protein [Planctomycetota bacterium]